MKAIREWFRRMFVGQLRRTYCYECMYYDGSESTGLCRRDTPKLFSEDEPAAIWPVVEPADWCGNGRPK